MTLEEASRRFCIPIAYAGAGLLTMPDGQIQGYSEGQIRLGRHVSGLAKSRVHHG